MLALPIRAALDDCYSRPSITLEYHHHRRYLLRDVDVTKVLV